MSRGPFTSRELSDYEAKLTDQERRLSAVVSRLEAEALRPTTPQTNPDEAPAHEADRQTREGEDQLAITLLGSEESVLAETRAALTRLRNGTYGTCEGCGHAISRARLETLPHARRCIRCERASGEAD
jgi:DnaK suppressor protein